MFFLKENKATVFWSCGVIQDGQVAHHYDDPISTRFVIPAFFFCATYPIYPQMFGQQMLTLPPCHPGGATMPGSDAPELVILQRSWIPLTPGAAFRGAPHGNLGIVPLPLRTSMSLLGALYTSCPGRTGTAGGTMTTRPSYSISTSKLLVSKVISI